MALPTSKIIVEIGSIYCEFILLLNAYKVSAHLNFTGASLIKITKAEIGNAWSHSLELRFTFPLAAPSLLVGVDDLHEVGLEAGAAHEAAVHVGAGRQLL